MLPVRLLPRKTTVCLGVSLDAYRLLTRWDHLFAGTSRFRLLFLLVRFSVPLA